MTLRPSFPQVYKKLLRSFEELCYPVTTLRGAYYRWKANDDEMRRARALESGVALPDGGGVLFEDDGGHDAFFGGNAATAGHHGEGAAAAAARARETSAPVRGDERS